VLLEFLADQIEVIDVLLLQLLHYLEQRLRLCDVVPVPAPLLENGPLPLEEFPAIRYMALGLLQVIEKHLTMHPLMLPPPHRHLSGVRRWGAGLPDTQPTSVSSRLCLASTPLSKATPGGRVLITPAVALVTVRTTTSWLKNQKMPSKSAAHASNTY